MADYTLVGWGDGIGPRSYPGLIHMDVGIRDTNVTANQAAADITTLQTDVKLGPTWSSHSSLGLVPNSTGAAAANLSAINTAFAANKSVYIGPGPWYINDSIQLPTRSHFRGDERFKTNILITDQSKHCITVADSAVDLTVEKLGLESANGVNTTAQNAAIKFGDAEAGYRHTFKDLIIQSFYYGIYAPATWWSSYIESVVPYDCQYSLRVGPGSIENTFVNFYSFNPRAGGVWLDQCHRYKFIASNFGGHPTLNNEYAARIHDSHQVSFDTCNFEQVTVPAFNGATSQAQGAAVIASGASLVRLVDCAFTLNAGAAATGYQTAVLDPAVLYMDNCRELDSGANISSTAVYGTAARLETRGYRMANPPVYQSGANAGTTLKDYDGMASAFEAPTVAGGWANLSGHVAGYRRDANGVVRLKGVVTGGAFASTTVLFTLPTGYRPSETIDLPALNRNSSTNVLTTGHVRINTNGEVVAYAGGTTGANAHLSLDNIRFQGA